jgi:hypothetical protein
MTSVIAMMLAPLAHASRGICARILAPNGRRGVGCSYSELCRNPRRGRAESLGRATASVEANAGSSDGVLAGTCVAVASRWRRSQRSARGRRKATLRPRRRPRPRRKRCVALGSSSGSPWRHSSVGGGSGAAGGSSVAAALRARPVICPVSRSVSYQSSSAAPAPAASSLRCNGRTVASGGGWSDRLPLPESLSMDAQIR